MRNYLQDLCEGIDAAVFSGDVLFSDDERKELKEYIDRWETAIVEHDSAEAAQPVVLDRDTIRQIFMAHGFTIKDGQTDLKPYVYEAADALLRAMPPASVQPVAVPDGYLLVPVKPTKEMCLSFCKCYDHTREFAYAYQDMLSAAQKPECWCHTCRPVNLDDMRMVLCPDCGNKRCPRANDHRNACTGSNEPGQAGSDYTVAQKGGAA